MKCPNCHLLIKRCDFRYCPDCGTLLEGMQGPEQGLVGESRSDCPKGHAEEAKPGERGVGKIVERTELLRIVERKLIQARRWKTSMAVKRNNDIWFYFDGRQSVLMELRKKLYATAEKRSDLPNASVMARPDGGPNQ